MNAPRRTRGRVPRSIRRLLDAIDRTISAAKELEQARDAVARESERLSKFRVVGAEGDTDER
jgi:hypothetical protein